MITLLKDLVKLIPSRSLGNVIKAKHPDIYNWVITETKNLSKTATISEKIHYLLQGKPDLICKYNHQKKFVPGKNTYGFCGAIAKCKCFREHAASNTRHLDYSVVAETRKKLWLEKYGVDNPVKNQEVQSKRKITLDTNKIKNSKILKTALKAAGYTKVVERVSSVVSPEFDQSEYVGCFRKNFYNWKCNICNNIFPDHVDYGRTPKCPVCYPKEKAAAEREIADWLASYNVKVELNIKSLVKPYEIDIWLPDYNIGIEHNGVYWHSTQFKSPTYHIEKTIAAKNASIKLIHVFSDEWEQKKDIVKSRILSLLKLSPTVYARKLSVKIISGSDYKSFTDTYHLQGHATATIKLGLVDENNQLHAIMSFSRSRYEQSEYELIRYCSKGTVVGGAGKLFSFFIKNYNPTTVVSYANRNWSDGAMYLQLGFTDCTTDQLNTGVFYFKNKKRYHRLSLSKKELVKQGGDPSKTGDQLIEEFGYLKIHDCGNLKLVWCKNS